jgi:hypothetical protein
MKRINPNPQEISILKEHYCPNDADFEERVFAKLKSIPPLHLLVPLKSFFELSTSANIVYGTFNSQRQISKGLVAKSVNPFLKSTVVQDTKKILKLEFKPKIVSNRKERRANPRIEAVIPSNVKEDWFGSMFVREQKLLANSIGFQKIMKRMKRNSKLIFGGKSGGYINELFQAKGFDQEDKSLLLFKDPRKKYHSKSKISLDNIQFQIGSFGFNKSIEFIFIYTLKFILSNEILDFERDFFLGSKNNNKDFPS